MVSTMEWRDSRSKSWTITVSYRTTLSRRASTVNGFYLEINGATSISTCKSHYGIRTESTRLVVFTHLVKRKENIQYRFTQNFFVQHILFSQIHRELRIVDMVSRQNFTINLALTPQRIVIVNIARDDRTGNS